MKRLSALVLAVATVGPMALAGPAGAGQKFVVIGGGATTGVYYQVALHACKLMNEELGSEGYSCIGRPSLGSVFNVNAVNRGLLNFGVVQSDRNWQAFHGEADWKGKAVTDLRSVFSVHPETVMLVTRADTGITSVTDLRGKRVNIGNPGSGQRGNAEDVLRLSGIDKDKDLTAEGLQQDEASRALVDRKLDAFFYTVGNPWGGGLEIANSTELRMVPIDSPAIKKFVGEHPYYVMTTIPSGIYKGVDRPVPTYAVKATVVTSAREPDDVVYDFVRAVFENLGRFREAHAAFKHLEPGDMLAGLSAPLHPGAEKYFKEKGLR